MFEIEQENSVVANGAKIRVVGIGGGGCNAVNTMIRAGLTGVEYIVANTDQQALNANLAPTKIQLGAEITKGLGAGANPEVGRKAALDEYEKLSEVLEGSDMIFITAGMGGGTGTGAAPVIAKLAKELGALTVGVVTKPFLFEGKKRFRQADAGIQVLEENVDSLITIPNQRLLYMAGESLSLVDTFKKADEVLLNAVRGISDLINTTGHINADFADVKTVMVNKGLALMGTGLCSGPDRAIKAATEAISSPLLEDISINGATGIIINITGNDSLTMHETNEAVTLIMEAADEDAEIIFGTVIDDTMEDNIKVTVVATGLGGLEKVHHASVTRTEQMVERLRPEPVVQRQAPKNWENNQNTEMRTQDTAHVSSQSTEQTWSQPASQEVKPETVEEFVSAPVETQNWDQPTYREREEMPARNEAQANSSLAQSIRDAATRYESGKTEQVQTAPARPAQQESVSVNRAKSIAEKLGFINFDEDELDTPSFLRKDENQSHNNAEF
ncbi:cell division protein FtsZ [Halobacteriovorax sp. HLS]|uniref:cell division protein FtsZ n=1 Tax=Halobacteriovorax sp. HLS TaxID=2234000 RepID=UPI000FDCC62C|nr:cell division protein FtsZ [Halobacteriovorax sp. HLS]